LVEVIDSAAIEQQAWSEVNPGDDGTYYFAKLKLARKKTLRNKARNRGIATVRVPYWHEIGQVKLNLVL